MCVCVAWPYIYDAPASASRSLSRLCYERWKVCQGGNSCATSVIQEQSFILLLSHLYSSFILLLSQSFILLLSQTFILLLSQLRRQPQPSEAVIYTPVELG